MPSRRGPLLGLTLAGSSCAVVAVLLALASGGGCGAAVSNALGELASLPYLQWAPVAEEDRGKSGITRWDRERAWPGLNVYCSESRAGGTVMDMDGSAVLALPDRRREPENCQLLEQAGDGGWIMLTVEGTVLLLDARGRIRMAENREFHHDAVLAADGRLYALAGRDRWFPRLLVRPIRDDLVLVLDRRGNLLREISFAALIAEDPPLRRLVGQHPERYQMSLFDNVFHANSVELLAADVERDGHRLFRRGQLLVCLRNLDLVGVLDLERERFVWTWGPGQVEHPHHPSMLPGGNLLIFDNGRYRGWSRVIELDAASGEVVWEYRGDPPASFYSRSRGAAQRLPNGNTLITESDDGRAFEVTTGGEIVWEFWEGALREGHGGELERATIYRMARVAAGSVSPSAMVASER